MNRLRKLLTVTLALMLLLTVSAAVLPPTSIAHAADSNTAARYAPNQDNDDNDDNENDGEENDNDEDDDDDFGGGGGWVKTLGITGAFVLVFAGADWLTKTRKAS